MSHNGRHYKGYKAGAVQLEEYRIKAFHASKTQEFWCPFCPAYFTLEVEYKEHYRRDHLELHRRNDHVLRVERLRALLLRKIRSRNVEV